MKDTLVVHNSSADDRNVLGYRGSGRQALFAIGKDQVCAAGDIICADAVRADRIVGDHGRDIDMSRSEKICQGIVKAL